MTILTIILGALELAALSILTGCLVTLAALSHVVEWIFIIVNPTIIFFLNQVNDLILFLIILMARLTSRVVAGMFPCRETNSSSCVVRNIDQFTSEEDTDEGISFPDQQELEELQEDMCGDQISV